MQRITTDTHPSRSAPLCKDCRYSRGTRFLHCDNPQFPVNPVDGEPKYSCANARSKVWAMEYLRAGDMYCGENGDLFEPSNSIAAAPSAQAGDGLADRGQFHIEPVPVPFDGASHQERAE